MNTEPERPATRVPETGASGVGTVAGAAGAPEDGASAAAGSAGPRASNEEILDALSQVFDPEIGIDIVNLGLVYEASIGDDGLLTVDMTLTSPYCPMGNIIQSQAHAVVASLPGVSDVRVNLVWQPPWDPHTMASEEARLELGIY